MLNKSKGNMYDFITHTFNTIKGECPHGCTYCYMHRWGKQKPIHFDEKELKTDLGTGNFIFVGSSCDMFAESIPEEWILSTIRKCYDFRANKYLFQTKNPERILKFNHFLFREHAVICTTLESDMFYPEIMKDSPDPMQRSLAMDKISRTVDVYVTIEPVIDFNLEHFVTMIKRCHPKQVNIGADSGNNHLPEPSKEKLLELIQELQKFTVIARKTNLARLMDPKVFEK